MNAILLFVGITTMKNFSCHLGACGHATGLIQVIAVLFLTGCANMGMNEFSFEFPELEGEDTVILARDPAALAGESEVEVALSNAVALSEKKRFAEARGLLADIRSIQEPKSEGYRALSTSMALTALHEVDIAAFRRAARQLDDSLGRPIRVDTAHVGVVSLYRAMTFQSLPVNAPDDFRVFREKYFSQRPAVAPESSPEIPVKRAGL